MKKKNNTIRDKYLKQKSIKDFNKQQMLRLYVDNFKSEYLSFEYKERIKNLRNRGYKAFVNEVGNIVIGDKYVICEHIDEIADTIDDLLNDRIIGENGEVIKFLYVSLVSQGGKTTAISDKLPVYVASNYGFETMLVSFSESLSNEMSDANKRLVGMISEEMGIKLAKGKKDDSIKNQKESWSIVRKVDNYDINKKVDLIFKNFTQIEGRRCKVMILDDVISTDTTRTRNGRNLSYDKYIGKLVSRRPEYIIVVGTRYHKDDLYSRILKNEKGLWSELIIPVYREGKNPLGYERGWTDDYWNKIRLRMGEEFWFINAMCDVSVKDKDKLPRSIFSSLDFEYYSEDVYRRIISIDGASSTSEKSDYTAFICCDVLTDGSIVIVDIYQEQISIIEGSKKLNEFISRNFDDEIGLALKIEDTPEGKYFIDNLLIDNESIYNKNIDLIQLFKVNRNGNFGNTQTSKKRRKRYHVGKKEIRYERNYSQLMLGNFYYLEDLNEEFINELIYQVIDFTDGVKNDDLVDVFMTVIESVYNYRMNTIIGSVNGDIRFEDTDESLYEGNI